MGAGRAEKDRARLIAPHFVRLDQPVEVETLRLYFIDSMHADADGGNAIGVDGPGEEQIEAERPQDAASFGLFGQPQRRLEASEYLIRVGPRKCRKRDAQEKQSRRPG